MPEQRLEKRPSETPLLETISRAPRDGNARHVLAGGGDMGALVRAFDWAATPLGPVDEWPQSLATTASTCLNSRFPILLWWGPRLVMLYNDAYRPILGGKHPASLGAAGREVFPEVWDIIGPMLRSVLDRGEATWSEDQLLLLERNGFPEECYFTFSYSPVRDESGSVGGVFTAVTETTDRVIGERRIATLRALAERTSAARSPGEAAQLAIDVIAEANADLPFALLYLAEPDGTTARLAGSAHVADASWAPEVIPLDADGRRPWPERSLVLPVAAVGQERPRGLLVAGLSPRLQVGDAYTGFLRLVAGQVATSIANAEAYDDERRRAEALAELDRAKTTFFSNVSHEFRTPLTLLLGPTEEALAARDTSPANRERLEVVLRNAHRLLRLVNTLLDFSRIEAGRLEASYERTDLGGSTAELASAFRSAVERAGLKLEVECPSGIDAYVDHDMWEKIVLNLLSNAFRHTFEGSIAVRLRRDGPHAELTVEDTGVGIPADELPRVFDRFHRVPNARGRSQEGTGIGLAFVQELVRLHGGQISIVSEVDRGTIVTIRIPLGSAHLAPERTKESAPRNLRRGAAPYVEEALRWLPAESQNAEGEFHTGELPLPEPATQGARVLLADDNADMRDYVARLLRSQGWTVEAVSDGVAALRAVAERRPALIVADVMMPTLDGFGLLRALRNDPRIADIPILLLSARAGEESRIEGLAAGADDYLVKPFSARELVARVGAHLSLGAARSRAAAQVASVHHELEEAHARVRAEQSRLAWVLRQAPAFMCVVRGPEHVFELANDAYLRLVGREVIGKPVREALPEFETQGVFQLLDRVVESGEPVVGREVPIVLEKDGAKVESFVTFVYEPIVEPDGTRSGVFVLGNDVTDEVLTRRDLERARVDAEAANRTKTEFLAAMSHELRTPLNAIAGYAQLLEMGVHGPLNEAQLEATRRIHRSEQHLLSLINDVLNFAKLEAGRIEYDLEKVALAGIVASVTPLVEPQLRAKGLEFAISSLPEVPVRADREKLRQVMVNLLSNAVKFTPRGGRVWIDGRDDGQGHVSLSVSDSGIGIAADKQDAIFDPFVQINRNLTRSTEGTGLGLAISRDLARGMGGELTVVSRPGAGSTFTVSLPVA